MFGAPGHAMDAVPATVSPHEVAGEGPKAAFLAVLDASAPTINTVAGVVWAQARSHCAPFTHFVEEKA